jgi:hypothetical protein
VLHRDWSERVAYCDDEASTVETDAWESRWTPIEATTLRAILVNYLHKP